MKEIKVHVEIGENLKTILIAMVNKIAACESGQYYWAAYEQIQKTIVGSIREAVKKEI